MKVVDGDPGDVKVLDDDLGDVSTMRQFSVFLAQLPLVGKDRR